MLKRWTGPMSLCLFLKESQIDTIDQALSPYVTNQITWTFYVVKAIKSSVYATYVGNMDKAISFKEPIFPINLVRDLAIESIDTTHFLFADIDYLVSKTLRANLDSYSDVLSKQNVIILLPTFALNWRLLKSCRKLNTCENCCYDDFLL